MTYYVIFRQGILANSVNTHVLTNRERADEIARMAREEAEREGTEWGYRAVDSDVVNFTGRNTDLNPPSRRHSKNLKGELS